MSSPRLSFVNFAFIGVVLLYSVVSLAQVDTYRPDLIWAVGQDQSVNECFGMNQIRFDRGLVEVFDLDSVGIQSFRSANVQYCHPDFTLIGNSFRLTRGYSDSLLTLLNFDTDPFRRDETMDGSFGAQTVLPLGSNRIAYIGETIFLGNFNSDFWFVTPGFSSAFLDVDSLSTSSSAIQTKPSFFTNTGDTLIDRLFEHVSHPQEGWWGLSKSAVSNRIVRWRVFEDTILLIDPIEVGQPGFRREGAALDLTFRPKGDAFAISGSDHGLDLYYFDRVTGEVSLWDEIDGSFDPDFEPYFNGTRCEWSADGRYLYVTTEANLYQFDTEASDIAASAVQINDPASIPFPGSYFQIERGPDCRIYVARSGVGKTISVIDKPSRPGRACDLKDNGLVLPNWYFVSIPEFPEYSLWAKDRVARGLAPIIDTAVCDSSIAPFDYFDFTVGTTDVIVEAENLQISPNPASSGTPLRLTYTLPTSLKTEVQKPLQARLFSMSGQQVGNLEIISIDSQEARVQLPEGMPTGMYRLLVSSSTTPILEGKVVVQ